VVGGSCSLTVGTTSCLFSLPFLSFLSFRDVCFSVLWTRQEKHYEKKEKKERNGREANDNTNIRFPFLWNLMFVPAVRRMSFARFLWVLVLACGSSTPTHTRTGTNRASVHRNLFITLPSSREKWRQAVSVFVFCLSPQLLSTESLGREAHNVMNTDRLP